MTTDRVDGLNDDFYYDPFDREIDKNPYPIWKRLRDEAPWWYNERKDFYTLSRFADVEEVMRDWDTYRSCCPPGWVSMAATRCVGMDWWSWCRGGGRGGVGLWSVCRCYSAVTSVMAVRVEDSSTMLRPVAYAAMSA